MEYVNDSSGIGIDHEVGCNLLSLRRAQDWRQCGPPVPREPTSKPAHQHATGAAMSVNIFLRLLIDRIRFHVLMTGDGIYGVVWSQLEEICALKSDLLPGWKVTIHKLKYGKTQLRFRPGPNRQIAHIEIGTAAQNKRYFQLDLSPSKFQPGEFEALQQVLTVLLEPFSYDKLFYSVPVSYLELASDCLTQPMSAFIPFRTKTFSSYAHPLESGKGTYYYGSEKGRLRFAVYNKRKHIQEKLKQTPAHAIQTRIEARIHTTGLPAAMLKDGLENPFTKLEIADQQKFVETFSHPKLKEFLSDCDESGSGYALGKLSVKDRRKFLSGLRKARAPWWNPIGIWKGLLQALSKITPLAPGGH